MSSDLVSLRASGLPMAFRCAGSARSATLAIEETSEPASLGSAVHEALRPLAEGAGLQWESLEAIADKWGVNRDELRMLCAIANKLWPTVAEHFPDASTEVELVSSVYGVPFTGHADVLSVVGTVARGADYKTGRKDVDYAEQMRGYCALVLMTYEQVQEVTFTVLWLRDGDLQNYSMTRKQLAAWLESLRAKVIEWSGAYRPGPHCDYCRRSHECDARNALVRRDVASLMDVHQDEASVIAQLAPEQKLALYRRAKMVKETAERVTKAIRQNVEAYGNVVTDNGKLVIEIEKHRELQTLAAWPVLEAAGFQDADFADVVDVSISRVEKRIAKNAGRGNGAAAVRELSEKLNEACAIRIKDVAKLREKT